MKKHLALPKSTMHLRLRIVNLLQKRILNQLQLNSSENYIQFLKQYPGIENYALNYHIASYLGITTQSLSRIRKGLLNLRFKVKDFSYLVY